MAAKLKFAALFSSFNLDLLSSIYYAQKAKDSAMEERLKIALEERDAALQEIDDLIHALTRFV